MKHQLILSLTLQTGSGHEAARQLLALGTPDDWKVAVEFALAVVLLQESMAAQVEYWVAPRQRA